MTGPLHVTTTDTTRRDRGGFCIMSGCHTCGWVWVRDTHPATPEWMGLRMGHAMADQHEQAFNGSQVTT